MPLEIEDRPSDSPYVERVWRSRSSDGVDRMTSVATPRWGLVFWEQGGRARAAVTGPESKASPAPVPEDATFFGIDFALGATLPHFPVGRLVDRQCEIPDTTRRSFRPAGSTWQPPDYDTAEAFVRRLVREGIVVRDPLVADVVRDVPTRVSARTVQRRFLATTGLTRDAVRQIDRARRAAMLMRQGERATDVVDRLGYYDQPHLARSLHRFIGRTATELKDGERDEPLSLLYKT
jgi:AraC-like DNA-binding protein